MLKQVWTSNQEQGTIRMGKARVVQALVHSTMSKYK